MGPCHRWSKRRVRSEILGVGFYIERGHKRPKENGGRELHRLSGAMISLSLAASGSIYRCIHVHRILLSEMGHCAEDSERITKGRRERITKYSERITRACKGIVKRDLNNAEMTRLGGKSVSA